MAPWNCRHHYFASFHGTIPASTASSPRSGPPPRGRGPSLYCGIPHVSHIFTFLLRHSRISASCASRCRVPRVLQPNFLFSLLYYHKRPLPGKGVAPRGKPVPAQTFIRRLALDIVRSRSFSIGWVHCYRFATRSECGLEVSLIILRVI